MALPGIEGFLNVHEILEAVSARSVDDKFRLRRAARKIRLVLMCADNKTLKEEDRASLIAILGLLVIDWDQAEDLRLEAAQEYLHVRAKAGICCDIAVGRVENKIRHYLLDELNDKQKRYLPPGRVLKSIKVENEREAKENLQQLGLGFRFPLLKMYPDRAFTHPVSKQVLEDRAMEQRFDQKFNGLGLVEFENSHLLNFLFDGYIDALLKHHQMETFNDFDPDLDGIPTVAVSKPDIPTVTESKPLPSEVGGNKSIKNKKRNQRKRAAEKTKKKEAATTSVSESESDTSTRSQIELETSMALVKIGPSSPAQPTETPRPKVKFVPQPMDKKWMAHPCLSGEGCTEFFGQLHEAMLRVPTANLESRVYGSQT